MARSKRIPVQRDSVLVVVEGETDQAFCKYLKSQLSPGRGIQIVVENAHGGSPDKIIEHARNLNRLRRADRVIIIFDGDKAMTETGEALAEKMNAEIIQFHPCIEGFFLLLLGEKAPPMSKECKRAFRKNYLNKKDAQQSKKYEDLFPLDQFSKLSSNSTFERLRQIFFNEKEAE
jgi:5S rRNA maturation endonuclease (ribonuclease M5)